MKKRVIIGLFFFACVALPSLLLWYRNTTSAIRVLYVEWGLVQLIEEYAEANQGNLPNSWDDLDPFFEQQGNLISCNSLEDVKSMIDVDFQLLTDCKVRSRRNFVSRKQFAGDRSIVDCNGKLLKLKTKHCEQIKKELEQTAIIE